MNLSDSSSLVSSAQSNYVRGLTSEKEDCELLIQDISSERKSFGRLSSAGYVS